MSQGKAIRSLRVFKYCCQVLTGHSRQIGEPGKVVTVWSISKAHVILFSIRMNRVWDHLTLLNLLLAFFGQLKQNKTTIAPDHLFLPIKMGGAKTFSMQFVFILHKTGGAKTFSSLFSFCRNLTKQRHSKSPSVAYQLQTDIWSTAGKWGQQEFPFLSKQPPVR